MNALHFAVQNYDAFDAVGMAVVASVVSAAETFDVADSVVASTDCTSASNTVAVVVLWFLLRRLLGRTMTDHGSHPYFDGKKNRRNSRVTHPHRPNLRRAPDQSFLVAEIIPLKVRSYHFI